MILQLHPYPAYKASGVEWLGDVPAHWNVQRAECQLRVTKRLVGPRQLSDQVVMHYSIPDVQQTGTGVVQHGSSIDSGKLLIDRTLLLISKLNPRMGTIVLAKPNEDYVTIASSEFVSVEPKRCIVEFARLVFLSENVRGELSSRVNSATKSHQRCSPDDILKLPLPWPSLSEQTAIVRFLDYVDQRIQRYIRAKEKLIALLQEQKQAIIHQAVTGQVDVRTGQPYPAYKPSGVEWLGNVPKHWDIRRLQNVSDLRFSNVDKHLKSEEIPIRLCNYVDVYKNDHIHAGMPFMKATATADEVERFRLQPRDVLITKDSEVWNDIAVPALVQSVEDDIVSGYHIALLRSDTTTLGGEFLFRALQSRGVAYQFHVRANGVTRYGLSHNAIKSVRLPVPSLSEQTAIAEYLGEATANIDVAVDRACHEMGLLREYRTRLIADVVTGKLDVREAAAQLPDEDDKLGNSPMNGDDCTTDKFVETERVKTGL